MKVRIVEYRHDPHQNGIVMGAKPPRPPSLDDCDEPVSYVDPKVTDGWEPLITLREPLQIRVRMFYDVESVTQVSDEMDDADLPGQSFELEFDTGKTLTAHNAVLAESEAEVEVTSA